MSYFNSFPKWVLNHYERIRDNNGICDILDCSCHWVDSLKDPKIKAAWDKKQEGWRK